MGPLFIRSTDWAASLAARCVMVGLKPLSKKKLKPHPKSRTFHLSFGRTDAATFEIPGGYLKAIPSGALRPAIVLRRVVSVWQLTQSVLPVLRRPGFAIKSATWRSFKP